jgi:hypothetical protein
MRRERKRRKDTEQYNPFDSLSEIRRIPECYLQCWRSTRDDGSQWPGQLGSYTDSITAAEDELLIEFV